MADKMGKHEHTYIRVDMTVRVAVVKPNGDIVHGDVVGVDHIYVKPVGEVPPHVTSEDVKEKITPIAVGVATAVDMLLETNDYLKAPFRPEKGDMLSEGEEGREYDTRIVTVEVAERADGQAVVRVKKMAEGFVH